MPDEETRSLNHFALLSFQDAYWLMNENAKASFHQHWLAALGVAATNFDIYQSIAPAADILVWCALNAEELCAVSDFFERWATVTTPYRHLLRPVASWTGFARSSTTQAGPASSEIDPLSTTRLTYLLAYPLPAAVSLKPAPGTGANGDPRSLRVHSFGEPRLGILLCETDDLLGLPVDEPKEGQGTSEAAPLFTAVYHPAPHTMALWK